MKRSAFFSYTLCMAVLGCGGNTEPAAAPPPAPAPVLAPPVEPAPAPAAAAPAPEPTEEEKKRAAELQRLEADRAKFLADHQSELARFTPEFRAQARKLAETRYPNARAALKAAIAGPHRKPGNPERDRYRHPLETLEFYGFKPNLTVLEYGPGEGWYTELLAPALATRGKLLITTSDPGGPKDQRSTFYGERTKAFIDKAPELYGRIELITIDSKAPKLDLASSVDMVLLNRSLHGMHNNKVLDAWLAEFHEALKPNGVLGVEQHRAAPGANPDESSKQGYLPEAWVIEKIESAGFKLAGKSEINANPKDTKDHPEGVWSLPPTLRLGDQDRAKYEAIGESDRMTLKFVKVAKPAEPRAAAPSKP